MRDTRIEKNNDYYKFPVTLEVDGSKQKLEGRAEVTEGKINKVEMERNIDISNGTVLEKKQIICILLTVSIKNNGVNFMKKIMKSKKTKISNKTLCILLGIQVVFLTVLYLFVNVFINHVIIPRDQELAALLYQVHWYLYGTLGVLCIIFIPVCTIIVLYRILESLQF